jgi:5-methylcytosine-specific restriction endonuclease McrA
MSNFEQTFADLSQQITDAKNTRFEKELISEWKQYHEFYLKSDQWQKIKQKRLHLDKNTCQMCNTKKNLHVHHLTYQNAGAENIADLLTVCNSCHNRLHGSGLS